MDLKDLTSQDIVMEKYQIVREVGRGGMGVVYLATDIRLEREVALKELVLSRGIIGVDRQEVIERFKREAQTAAKLNHPNIITIFDVGEENNRYFIAMEYLPGKTLKDYLDEKKVFKVEEILDILIQVLSGLEHAHSKGIVHRDIKPENIKILDEGSVKIMDFGIASIESKRTGLTQDGSMLGTIAYMSPEQLYSSKSVDSRADIFSFGAMMYEVFSGKLPFEGETIGETIIKIMTQNPVFLRELNKRISEKIENIVHKCLERDVDKRYQKIKDVYNELVFYKMCLSHKELQEKIILTDEQEKALGVSSPDTTVIIKASRLTSPDINFLKKRKFHILHVEDDATLQNVFLSYMTKRGVPYDYTFVESVGKAIEILNSKEVDFIISDYMLPDGTANDITAMRGKIPMLVTTSVQETNVIIEIMKKGILDYVVKTSDFKYLDKIYEIIDETIEKEELEFKKVDRKFEINFIRTVADKINLLSPRHIHLNDNRLIIADTKNSRVVITNKSGEFIAEIKEELKIPCAIATDIKNNIYVLDADDCYVKIYSPSYKLINKFGGKGNSAGKMQSVYGITIFREQKIFVTDPDGHRVNIFDMTGSIIKVIGENDIDHGIYKSPSGITCDNEKIYILDHGTASVKVLNSNEKLVLNFGKRGTADGDFSVPKGIQIDDEGRIYVTETLNHRIQVFDNSGKWILKFGAKGTGDGQFNMADAVTISNKGEIFVLDKGNNRVQLFSF